MPPSAALVLLAALAQMMHGGGWEGMALCNFKAFRVVDGAASSYDSMVATTHPRDGTAASAPQ
jgi:hypothetical protein